MEVDLNSTVSIIALNANFIKTSVKKQKCIKLNINKTQM